MSECLSWVESRHQRWQCALMRKLALPLLLTVVVTATTQASPRDSDPVRTFVRQMLQTSAYKGADADLNGVGLKESFIYVTDPDYCGSGGCSLVVLSPRGNSYAVVMRTTVTNLPITVLRTAAYGWLDVGVTVEGAGIIRPYVARLRFNGHRYPSNPTIPPAIPLPRTSGSVLIGG